MKHSLTFIHTFPPTVPGSMSAYASLVTQALATLNSDDFDLRHCRLHAPEPNASMWRHHFWRLRHGHRTIKSMPSDLYHLLDGSMAMFLPRHIRSRTVVTVHDLIPLLQVRHELPGRQSLPAKWLALRSARTLSQCLSVGTDSENTSRDLERLQAIVPASVVPLAVKRLPDHLKASSAFVSVVSPYLLHVGNNAAYKNREGVLEVFCRLSDITDLRLIMVGPEPTPALRRRAEALRNVSFRVNVSDAELAALYHDASVFLFPSLYEGFGMPVLEAMSAGCPVVCSANGSLREVAGDAALMAAATDVGALAAHCRNLLKNQALRERVQQLGRERAAQFTLQRMGSELLAWYRQACEEKR